VGIRSCPDVSALPSDAGVDETLPAKTPEENVKESVKQRIRWYQENVKEYQEERTRSRALGSTPGWLPGADEAARPKPRQGNQPLMTTRSNGCTQHSKPQLQPIDEYEIVEAQLIDEYEIVEDDLQVHGVTADQLMSILGDDDNGAYGLFEEEQGEPLCIGDDEWEDVVLTVTADSGAGNHVLSREDIPGYAVGESAGSRAGRGFVGVSGDRIDNEGEAELNLAGPSGAFRSTFQVAKVNRPLMSIARICDKGHTVIFCKTHASVQDSRGQEICKFLRKGNLYMIDVTLKAPGRKTPGRTAGFTRPGR